MKIEGIGFIASNRCIAHSNAKGRGCRRKVTSSPGDEKFCKTPVRSMGATSKSSLPMRRAGRICKRGGRGSQVGGDKQKALRLKRNDKGTGEGRGKPEGGGVKDKSGSRGRRSREGEISIITHSGPKTDRSWILHIDLLDNGGELSQEAGKTNQEVAIEERGAS